MTLSTLQTQTRWLTGTNSTSYGDTDLTRQLNRNYHDLVVEVLTSMDGWDFAGEIATFSLVADQEEYTFPTTLLRIKRMELMLDGSTWKKAEPIDVQEIGDSIATDANTRNSFTKTNPRYDSHDGSFFILPSPDTAVTNGGKIWYEKEVSDLSASGDEPTLAENFHHLLAIGASYDYAIKKGLPVANLLLQKLELGKRDLREFYNRRVQDRNYNFGFPYSFDAFK